RVVAGLVPATPIPSLSPASGDGWGGARLSGWPGQARRRHCESAKRFAPSESAAAPTETMMASSDEQLAAIQRQIMWNRLIAVTEQQAQILIRTAFSTTVREAGDLSAGVFDLKGRMLAQAVTGTPGHVNSMSESVGHFLKKFPVQTMREGDHYIT